MKQNKLDWLGEMLTPQQEAARQKELAEAEKLPLTEAFRAIADLGQKYRALASRNYPDDPAQ